ncbi:MAG: alpha/beta hydrolase domain-containing protein [Bryobacteraceae bacterium]
MKTTIVLLLAAGQAAFAAVDRIEIKSREPFYNSKIGPYVKISGSFTGSLDGKEPIPNRAPRRADGRIEYGSEFTILAPEQPSAGNHVLLVDAENGGRPITNGLYNTPFGSNAGQPAGNGFLEDNGYTIVNVHWQEGRGIRLPQYTDSNGHSAPLLAVGFAAVRDFAAFLRFETKDGAGTANPVAGSIRWAIGSGQSQSSRFLKSFIYGGFNHVGDRMVIDGFQPKVGQSGTMPFIPPAGVSTKTLDLTITGDSSAFPFTYEEIFAPLVKRGEKLPKIIATNVEGDYIRRRLSLVRTGGSSTKDAPIPETVRLWDFAGASHGIILGADAQNCDMPRANLDWHPLTRVALIRVTRWVTANEPPPPTKLISVVPGDPSARYLLPAPTGDYPKARLIVPKRDSDGLSEGGIRLPAVAVPLQTFGGWNAPLENNCGDMSIFAYPFPKTRFERMMKNDPRPSIEERYASPAEYLSKFAAMAASLKKDGYLLDSDMPALMEQGRTMSRMVPEHKEAKSSQ